MKRFIVDKLIWPFVAILFFSGVGGCLIFFGNQTIRMDSPPSNGKTIVVNYTHEHFWGLWKIPCSIERVASAEIVSSSHRENNRIVSGSSVVLSTDDKKRISLGLTAGLDRGDMSRMVDCVNRHIQDHAGEPLSETFRIRTILYWIGLPFLALGIMGLLGWSRSIMKAAREINKTA